MTDETTPPHPPRRRLGPIAIGLVVAGLAGLGVARLASAVRGPKVADHRPAVLKGRDYLQRGRPDLALAAVSHVRDEGLGAGEALCVAGLALAQMEQYRDARLALERALALQPRQPMAAKTLAALHLSLGDTDRGIARLRQAAELVPRDPRPWSTMGRVFLDLGRPDDAADAFAEALKRNKLDSDARLGRAEALLTLGRAEEAGDETRAVLARSPADPRALGLAARSARDSGRADEALDLAGRALAVDPNNLDALLARATAHHVSGRPDLAGADLERAVAINPNHLAALNLLIQVEHRLGHPDRSADAALRRKQAQDRLVLMDALTQEISRRPDDPGPRFQMGLAAVEGNQRTLALNCFQAALALDPTHAPARRALDAIKGPNAARPPAGGGAGPVPDRPGS